MRQIIHRQTRHASHRTSIISAHWTIIFFSLSGSQIAFWLKIAREAINRKHCQIVPAEHRHAMEKKISDKEIAELVGVSPGFFSRMMRNQRRCSGGLARRLEELTQEDIRVWLFGEAKEKRQALERYRRRCRRE